jgi:hypothetical protein
MTDKSSKVKVKKTATDASENISDAPFDLIQGGVVPIGEKTVPTFEVLVAGELKKFDAVIPAVKELQARYMPMRIDGIEDVDGYKAVTEAFRFMVSKRTAIEDKRKELKADSLAFGKAVDGKAKEITEMLAPIELHLKSQKEVIDAEKKKIEDEKKLQEQAEMIRKHTELISAGMALIGNEYIWSSKLSDHTECLPSINIETLSDDDFNAFVSFIMELNKKDAEKIEEKRSADAAIAAKAEQDRLDLEESQAKLKEQQDAAEKERADLLQMRTDMRMQQLEMIGVRKVLYSSSLCYGESPNLHEIVKAEYVISYTAEGWKEKFEKIKVEVSLCKEQDDMLARAEQERKDKEVKALQKEADDRAAAKVLKDKQDADNKAEADRLAAIKLKEQQDADEAERVAGLSDKDKMFEYAERLMMVERPELKTAKWKKEMKAILDAIGSNMNP